MMTLVTSILGSLYLFFGFFSWLTTAVELMGETDNRYLRVLKEYSKKNVAMEVVSVIYLGLLWPLHLGLKAAFKE